MIQREHYIAEVRPFYESDLIKIITGIRRCGKSVIMEQIIEEISNKTDNIIYLNFEDKKVSANITNADKLISYVEENKQDGKCYLFFDEIQTLEGWQELVLDNLILVIKKIVILLLYHLKMFLKKIILHIKKS